jgi:hypothetical protein
MANQEIDAVFHRSLPTATRGGIGKVIRSCAAAFAKKVAAPAVAVAWSREGRCGKASACARSN